MILEINNSGKRILIVDYLENLECKICRKKESSSWLYDQERDKIYCFRCMMLGKVPYNKLKREQMFYLIDSIREIGGDYEDIH